MSATEPTPATPDRPARAQPGPALIEFIPSGPVSAFPPGWRRLVAVQLAVFVAIGVIGGTVPGPIALALFAGSIGIGMLTNHIAKFEGTQIANIPRRFAVLVAGVVLPMALFGASLARWSIGEGAVAWEAAVAAISLVLCPVTVRGRCDPWRSWSWWDDAGASRVVPHVACPALAAWADRGK